MALFSKPLPALDAGTHRKLRSFAGAVIVLGVLVAILHWGRMFFITSISAVVIAFILEPLVELLIRMKMPRSVASFVVCTVALLFVYLMGLGVYSQVSGLLDELPKYSQRIGELVDSVRRKVESMEQKTYQLVVPGRQRELERQQAQQQAEQQAKSKRRPRVPLELPVPPALPPSIQEVRIREERSPITEFVYARLASFYQALLMVSFVPFLVYFMLSWRDHIHRSFLQLFSGEDRQIAARSVQGIADMVRAFVVGNFLLGVLLAVVSSLAFWWLKLPYPLLVGPLSGMLSLVPYIGLPLALIPPLFVALPVLTTFSAYLLVITLVSVLHLLALNLLYPSFVGSRVHLNPLVVTFSLMGWGFIWDAAGLLLAIPITAAMKAVCDNVKGLRPIGKFLGD